MKNFFTQAIFLVAAISLNAQATQIAKQNIDQILGSVKADLASGQIENAKNILDEASENFHSVAIELAIIQTLMQAGEYTHALSAAAHTQAEHANDSAPLLFYAWLLAVGGQDKAAKNLLLGKNGDQAKLLWRQIELRQLNAGQLMLGKGIYLGPIVSEPAFNHTQNAVILSDGLRALTTSRTCNNFFVVRTNTGKLINARPEKSYANSLCLIKLDRPITTPSSSVASLRAGIPVFIANLAITSEARWPELKTDVVGFTNTDLLYPLHLKNLAPGSGVYNSAGELVGLVVLNAVNAPLVIPVADVLESTSRTEKPDAIFDRAKPIAEIYQTALQQTLAVAEATSKE